VCHLSSAERILFVRLCSRCSLPGNPQKAMTDWTHHYEKGPREHKKVSDVLWLSRLGRRVMLSRCTSLTLEVKADDDDDS
jgi:hypothetical protein